MMVDIAYEDDLYIYGKILFGMVGELKYPIAPLLPTHKILKNKIKKIKTMMKGEEGEAVLYIYIYWLHFFFLHQPVMARKLT